MGAWEVCGGVTKAVISSLEKTFKLFKPPDRIGDIIEHKDESYLIIGIERVRFVSAALKVIYTCQNLNILHALQPEVHSPFDNYSEFYINIDTTKRFEKEDRIFSSDRENIIAIGRVFEFEKHYYRWITYTDLKFDFTTLRVTGLAQPIYPTTQTYARKKLINHKKKKIGLSLI